MKTVFPESGWERMNSAENDVRRSLAATIETLLPSIAVKYRIHEDAARDAIARAVTSTAIGMYTAATGMSDEEREQLEIHVSCMILGTIDVLGGE
jgi:hypothetical protein